MAPYELRNTPEDAHDSRTRAVRYFVMTWRSLLLSAILSLGLLATACGSTQVADTAESTPEEVQVTTTTVSAGNIVPLVGGGQLDLNSVQGTDTVLWFWAPW